MLEVSLTDLWEEYQVIMKSGIRTKRALLLEPLIHKKQKEMGSTIYDFDKRWEKVAKDGTPSVSGPSLLKAETTIKVPQRNFTIEEAMAIIGKNDCAILEECAKIAEARMVYLASLLDKMNPANANVARRGQAINVAINIFNWKKENE